MIAVVALRRVLGVRVPERRLSAATDARPGERGLHLEAVRFAYREDRPVLRGIDLDVTPGERLALVGGSGAGKSTLARLIAGISAPTSGAVRLDGYDVSTLDDDTLRGEVLLLTQEHHVFTGSVRDNLALPAGEFADDDLRAALELVGLGDWFATLPDGLATAVGSGATTVPRRSPSSSRSRGWSSPTLGTVVLDEATSLLDTASARRAEGALDRVLAGRTVIAIAHRLHTAAAADRVAVMADGEIVELGPPGVLLAAGGPYAAAGGGGGLSRTGRNGPARALWRSPNRLEDPCPTPPTGAAPSPAAPCSTISWAGWSTSTSACCSATPRAG